MAVTLVKPQDNRTKNFTEPKRMVSKPVHDCGGGRKGNQGYMGAEHAWYVQGRENEGKIRKAGRERKK